MSYFPPLILTIKSAQRELSSTISFERMNEGIHYRDDGQLLDTTSLYWRLLAPAFLFSLSFPMRKLKAIINHWSTAEASVFYSPAKTFCNIFLAWILFLKVFNLPSLLHNEYLISPVPFIKQIQTITAIQSLYKCKITSEFTNTD